VNTIDTPPLTLENFYSKDISQKIEISQNDIRQNIRSHKIEQRIKANPKYAMMKKNASRMNIGNSKSMFGHDLESLANLAGVGTENLKDLTGFGQISSRRNRNMGRRRRAHAFSMNQQSKKR
jgi:hypothetical protein